MQPALCFDPGIFSRVTDFRSPFNCSRTIRRSVSPDFYRTTKRIGRVMRFIPIKSKVAPAIWDDNNIAWFVGKAAATCSIVIPVNGAMMDLR